MLPALIGYDFFFFLKRISTARINFYNISHIFNWKVENYYLKNKFIIYFLKLNFRDF